MPHRARLGMPLVAALLLTVPACRVTDLQLWTGQTRSPDAFDVEEIRDVPYHAGPDATRRHRLDLFLPKGLKDYPVVVLVHGGAWVKGDNRCCGLYSSVGEFLASQGIGAVLPNYRLSPWVKHPEHAKDVAKAFAWVKDHIADHGGRPDQLFLAGHSAGGHLAALLATDESYLKAEGCSAKDMRGVITVSGVYRITEGSLKVALGGKGDEAVRLDQFLPLRSPGTPGKGKPGVLPGLPLSVNLFGVAFGNDPRAREAASPVKHVRPGLPPFLILSAERDLPLLPGMAEEFHQALREKGCDAALVRVEGRNHNSIMFGAITPEDPVARAVVDFVFRHAPPSNR